MGSKKTLETFSLSAKLEASVTVEIEANNIYEALEKAKELSFSDFIESTTGQFDEAEILGFSYIGKYDGNGFKLK